eukprot:PhF_6_TR26981/c0_g1_i1/m.39377
MNTLQNETAPPMPGPAPQQRQIVMVHPYMLLPLRVFVMGKFFQFFFVKSSLTPSELCKAIESLALSVVKGDPSIAAISKEYLMKQAIHGLEALRCYDSEKHGNSIRFKYTALCGHCAVQDMITLTAPNFEHDDQVMKHTKALCDKLSICFEE